MKPNSRHFLVLYAASELLPSSTKLSLSLPLSLCVSLLSLSSLSRQPHKLPKDSLARKRWHQRDLVEIPFKVFSALLHNSR